ncbi:MAG: pyridoxine 5'-phosphate synthase [Candidatus Omnitrophica bacterium]|nr:pyridoxine 5'-phosphate synthase [Candidatus Omnitrophota bacterium]
MLELGVNIDHVATLRQARGGAEPGILCAVKECEKAGCDSIVAHLREDRRHINDLDIEAIKSIVATRFNLEMSINEEIVEIARKIRPDQATLVPEKRQELTTEGGLRVNGNEQKIRKVAERLKEKGVRVSLFIDPDEHEVNAVKRTGVKIIEIHTGRYSDAGAERVADMEFQKIKKACDIALDIGLTVNAGHGLNYTNVKRVAGIKGINELNIGHSIISRAIFTGLDRAVREMKALMGHE